MKKNDTNDALCRVLETAVEVIGMLLLILPLFKSKKSSRRK